MRLERRRRRLLWEWGHGRWLLLSERALKRSIAKAIQASGLRLHGRREEVIDASLLRSKLRRRREILLREPSWLVLERLKLLTRRVGEGTACLQAVDELLL